MLSNSFSGICSVTLNVIRNEQSAHMSTIIPYITRHEATLGKERDNDSSRQQFYEPTVRRFTHCAYMKQKPYERLTDKADAPRTDAINSKEKDV